MTGTPREGLPKQWVLGQPQSILNPQVPAYQKTSPIMIRQESQTDGTKLYTNPTKHPFVTSSASPTTQNNHNRTCGQTQSQQKTEAPRISIENCYLQPEHSRQQWKECPTKHRTIQV
jgi:hypothetical protein